MVHDGRGQATKDDGLSYNSSLGKQPARKEPIR